MSDEGKAGMIGGSATTELAASRTGLALERTMMGADRTLMAIVRTALSMIGFGFTINQVFRQLANKGLLVGAERTGRRLGMALLALGVLLLVMGLISHVRFYWNLKQRRGNLLDLGLLHGVDHYRATPTFITAALLLALGLVTLASLMVRIQWW